MSKRDDAKIMIVDLLSGLWETPEISWTSRQMYKDRARDFVDFLIDAAKEEMETASSR